MTPEDFAPGAEGWKQFALAEQQSWLEGGGEAWERDGSQ